MLTVTQVTILSMYNCRKEISFLNDISKYNNIISKKRLITLNLLQQIVYVDEKSKVWHTRLHR